MTYPCTKCVLDKDCNDNEGKAKRSCKLLQQYLDSIMSKATKEIENEKAD